MKKNSHLPVLVYVGLLIALFPAAAFARPAVPEIDPNLAIGAVALLGGALVVIRARRSR